MDIEASVPCKQHFQNLRGWSFRPKFMEIFPKDLICIQKYRI